MESLVLLISDASPSGWWAGKLPDTDLVLWLPLFWWARIGKLLQLIAAFVIVIDLMGPERVRRLGTSMRVPVNSEILYQLGREAFTWVNLVWSLGPEAANKYPGGRGLRLIKILSPVLSILLAYLIWAIVSPRLLAWLEIDLPPRAWGFVNHGVGRATLGLLLFTAVSFTLGPASAVLVVIAPLAVARTAELALNGAAWVLAHERAEKILQVAFFVVFLLGFLLDFLAS